jgi:hypothetical protein
MNKKKFKTNHGYQAEVDVIPVYNIKADWPSLDEARRRLIGILDLEKRKRTRVIKIIHGWGSTGVGGKLKPGLQESLRRRIKEGKIRAFVDGKDFCFHKGIVQLLKDYPILTSDADFNKGNPGITIILIS